VTEQDFMDELRRRLRIKSVKNWAELGIDADNPKFKQMVDSALDLDLSDLIRLNF